MHARYGTTRLSHLQSTCCLLPLIITSTFPPAWANPYAISAKINSVILNKGHRCCMQLFSYSVTHVRNATDTECLRHERSRKALETRMFRAIPRLRITSCRPDTCTRENHQVQASLCFNTSTRSFNIFRSPLAFNMHTAYGVRSAIFECTWSRDLIPWLARLERVGRSDRPPLCFETPKVWRT